VKRQPKEWKKIFVSYLSGKELIHRIHKELKKSNTTRSNNSNNKWAIQLSRHFPNEEVQTAYKYMKKCSISFAIRKMQIKTTLRFYLTLVKMVILKKTISKCCQKCEGKGTLTHCWWECKLVQPPWKSVWKLLKELK
jgi:hypothetical protein